jgi:segregation and condensation protein A
MSEPESGSAPPDALVLHLDGFDGPLDLLLDLARSQKVDLARISILGLVEQFLAVVEGARRVRLELAADWLVMAAWLTWLKSRLLLPAGTEAAEEGELAAETLGSRRCRPSAPPRPGLPPGRRSAATCSPAARRRTSPTSTAVASPPTCPP